MDSLPQRHSPAKLGYQISLIQWSIDFGVGDDGDLEIQLVIDNGFPSGEFRLKTDFYWVRYPITVQREMSRFMGAIEATPR